MLTHNIVSEAGEVFLSGDAADVAKECEGYFAMGFTIKPGSGWFEAWKSVTRAGVILLRPADCEERLRERKRWSSPSARTAYLSQLVRKGLATR